MRFRIIFRLIKPLHLLMVIEKRENELTSNFNLNNRKSI